MKLISRQLKDKVLNSLKVSPVVFVNGPRQAGKSTLVQGKHHQNYLSSLCALCGSFFLQDTFHETALFVGLTPAVA